MEKAYQEWMEKANQEWMEREEKKRHHLFIGIYIYSLVLFVLCVYSFVSLVLIRSFIILEALLLITFLLFPHIICIYIILTRWPFEKQIISRGDNDTKSTN